MKSEKLNILENAFDFLNCSIGRVIEAKREGNQIFWKHALLNVSFCIELIMKERLRKEYPLLIYENINKYRPITSDTKTVDWDSLISKCKFIIGEKEYQSLDSGRINLARKYRNQIIHYHVYLEFPTVYYDFANLINFIRVFYETQLQIDEEDYLYYHINEEYRKENFELVSAFAEECVYYNETFMTQELKNEIIKQQEIKHVIIDGKKYKRIPYGDPKEFEKFGIIPDYSLTCHDCGVKKGQIHLDGCDMEQCPKCGEQLLRHEVKYVP